MAPGLGPQSVSAGGAIVYDTARAGRDDDPPLTLCNVVLNQSQGVLDGTVPFRICTAGISDLLAMNLWTLDQRFGSYLSRLLSMDYLGAAEEITKNRNRNEGVFFGASFSSKPLAPMVGSAYLALNLPDRSLLELEPTKLVPREDVVRFAISLIEKDLEGFQMFCREYLPRFVFESKSLIDVYNQVSNLQRIRSILKTMARSMGWGKKIFKASGDKTREPEPPWAAALAGILVNEPESWTPGLIGEWYVREDSPRAEGKMMVLPPLEKYLEDCAKLESSKPRENATFALPNQEGFVLLHQSSFHTDPGLNNQISLLQRETSRDPTAAGRWLYDQFERLTNQGCFSFQCPDLSAQGLSVRLGSLPPNEQVAVASTLYSLALVPCNKGVKGK